MNPLQLALERSLQPLINAERKRRLSKAMAFVWLIIVVVACSVFYWHWSKKATASPVLNLVWMSAIAGAFIAWLVARFSHVNVRLLALRVEKDHPKLQAALLTAMEQKPAADGRLGYLQQRVLDEVAEHARKHNWAERSFGRRSENGTASAGWAS